MPLAFTENLGQWDEKALFRANAGGATMWFTTEGAVYQFTRRVVTSNSFEVEHGAFHDQETPPNKFEGATQPENDVTLSLSKGGSEHMRDPFNHEPDSIEQLVIKANFVGANPNPTVRGEGLMEYKCNYFIGNDPNEWHTDVPNYQAIVLEEIYSGIDLKYYGNGKQMEYDFIVSPGTDFAQIEIEYEGAKSLSVNDAGELIVETDWGNVTELRPVVYQLEGDKRLVLDGEYVLLSENRFGFQLPDGYNAELTLVIDPVLSYSTYLGGSYHDNSYGISVDGSGNAYITGHTVSSDFPTQSAFQGTYGGGYTDAFVTKLNSSGNDLAYSTYLGGSDNDYGNGIAVDVSGCAYVTGYTQSSDFPTQDAYQTSQGDTDVFVTKLQDAVGAYCYDDLCAIETETACEAGDGDFQGGGTDCGPPNPCITCCIPPSVGDLDQSAPGPPPQALGFNYDGADLSMMIHGLFIDPTNGWDGICLCEADVDFTSARPVTDPMTIDGADLSELIDALFIAPTHYLKNCDGTDNW